MTAEMKDYIDMKFVELMKAIKTSRRDVIDINEAAEFTALSRSAIYKKVSKGEIPCYKRDGKVYFRRSELEKWLTACRVSSNDEIASKASLYVATH